MPGDDRECELKHDLFKLDYSFTHSYLIYKLLDRGEINDLIDRISDEKTSATFSLSFKDKFLSGNEQFIVLLDNFISFFRNDFYFINESFDYIVGILLKNQKYNSYLLCKKYIGDNDNISFFSNSAKKLITNGFFNNIKILSKESDIIDEFAKHNKIRHNISSIDKYSDDELDYIYDILIKISICNANFINSFLLFEDINGYISEYLKKDISKKEKVTNNIYNFYINQWEIMIDNYYKKIHAACILIDNV